METRDQVRIIAETLATMVLQADHIEWSAFGDPLDESLCEKLCDLLLSLGVYPKYVDEFFGINCTDKRELAEWIELVVENPSERSE